MRQTATASTARIVATCALLLVSASCALVVGIDDHYFAEPLEGGASGDGGGGGGVDGGGGVADSSPVTDSAASDGSDDGGSDAGVDAAPKALAFLQATAAANTGQQSLTLSFANPVKAGSALVVAVNFKRTPGDPSFFKFSDSMLSTYDQTPQFFTPTTVQVVGVATNVTGGLIASVRVDLNAVTDEIELYIHEYAGVSSTAPVILGYAATAATCAPGVPACLKSGAINVPTVPALLFGFGIANSVQAGPGFTARSTFNFNVSEDQFLLSDAGIHQATATLVTGSQTQMVGVAFRGQ